MNIEEARKRMQDVAALIEESMAPTPPKVWVRPFTESLFVKIKATDEEPWTSIREEIPELNEAKLLILVVENPIAILGKTLSLDTLSKAMTEPCNVADILEMELIELFTDQFEQDDYEDDAGAGDDENF